MASSFPARRFVVNGTSPNMVVNGSVTPVQFTIQPAAGQIFSANELIFNATGTGTINQPFDFWTLPALTNGISSEIRLNGVTVTQPGLIKNNFDLIQFVGADFVGKIIGVRNVVRGQFNITPPMNLDGNRGDYFRLTVNDNLTTSGVIEMLTVALRGSTIIL